MLENGQMTFCWKIWPNLGHIISETKCDRDKPIFSAEKGGQYDHGKRNKKSTQWDLKMSKIGVLPKHQLLITSFPLIFMT